MTKHDLHAIGNWFSKHEDYWICCFFATLVLIAAYLFAYDAWFDGGHCVNGMNWKADPEVCNPGGKAITWPELILCSIIPAVGSAITYLSLPVNTFLLWMRGLTYHGDKKRELKLQQREAAIRAREQELELEPYELGKVSK